MINSVSISREVVLIGGGHAHALFLRKWGMNPLPGVQISLISPMAETTYTGMLPGFLAGHYSREEISIDLIKLCRFAGARFIMASVNNIFSIENMVSIKDRASLRYDVASIDIGVTSKLLGPRLSNSNTHSIKPLGDFVDRWVKVKAKIVNYEISPEIVVIGGGIGAVEIAMAMAFSLKNSAVREYNITIIDKSNGLNDIRPQTRKAILLALDSFSIKTLHHSEVLEITETEVQTKTYPAIASNFTVVAAGASPYEWLKQGDLVLNNGFVEVDCNLRAVGFSNIFAVGDCAHLAFSPRPKAGVFAVRQAPILFKNICAELLKRPLKNFSPQKNYLKLISLGEKNAISDYWGGSFSGPKIWKIKDKIDKAFMNKFSDFPAMTTNPIIRKIDPAIADESGKEQLLCGGCGAKVGSESLNAVLKNISKIYQRGILAGIGDDAAVIEVKSSTQIITTDHLREFTSDLWIFSTITAVHSLGDIWAMGGQPHAVMAHIIIPEASKWVQESWLNQIMLASNEVFESVGAHIVGGHTSIGAEFSIGFSITGNPPKNPTFISGAKPGDVLVLTKPIGSGTILAGEMQLKVKGRFVESALTWMAKPQGEASKILSVANAMTDVTGFGLAGHLIRICESSEVSARLRLSSIPFLDGAEELAGVGIRSSLFDDNYKVRNRMSFVPTDKASLLFDPQTSGGLLAAIPQKKLSLVLKNLKKKGYCASVIGNIDEGEAFINVV